MGSLRILLAIGICYAHAAGVGASSHWMFEYTAVYVFFVISGFYMQMVLSTRYTPERLGDAWVRQFYLARYLRLFPAYAAACATMLGFALLVYTADGRMVQPFNSWARLYPNGDSWQLLYGMGVLASNFTMFGLNVPSSMDLIVGPSWTLGGELSFYLIAPFILRKSDRFLLVLFLAGLLIRLIPYNAHAPVLSSIEYFVMGALSYRKRDLLLIKVNSARWVDRTIPVAGMLLLMVISLPNLTLLSIPMTHNELTTIVYPPLFALLIPSLYRATEDVAVDRVVGELSYPFYIFHQVVLLVLIGLPWSSKGQFAFVVIIITLLIALLVWQIESRWIEPRRARLSIPVGERRGNARVPPVMGNIPLPVENR